MRLPLRSVDDELRHRVAGGVTPQAFDDLIDTLVESTAEYLIAQLEAGAEVLQIFESWAGTIPAETLDAYALAPIRGIIDRVRAYAPAVPIIVFPRGAGAAYPLYARETNDPSLQPAPLLQKLADEGKTFASLAAASKAA